MAVSRRGQKSHSLRSQINSAHHADLDMMLRLVTQHIEEAISRLGLQDVLAFTTSDLVGAFKMVYFLEQGSSEWRIVSQFIRLAAIYQLTPAPGLPLRLSADSLPTAIALRQRPLMMVMYRIIGPQLTYTGESMALRGADDGDFRIGIVGPFQVVSWRELPAGHRYRNGYKTSDPVIRCGEWLYRSFTAFLVDWLFAC